MLLDVEIPIAELTRGDRVVVELDGGNILGVVVGTNVKYGTIGFLVDLPHRRLRHSNYRAGKTWSEGL